MGLWQGRRRGCAQATQYSQNQKGQKPQGEEHTNHHEDWPQKATHHPPRAERRRPTIPAAHHATPHHSRPAVASEKHRKEAQANEEDNKNHQAEDQNLRPVNLVHKSVPLFLFNYY
ncbi:MAG: hypothetical protein ACUVV0_07080 [Anaerolineae bacterium]